MLKRSLLSLVVIGLALAAKPAQAELQWSDNSFHLWYGTSFAEPAEGTVAKTVLTFQHVDAYKWGGNFLNIDLLYSNTADHIQGVSSVNSVGAAEVYAVYRNTLSFNKIGSTKTFSFGPIRDVGFVVGVDANTKNHGFSARKIMPIAGFALAFDVPGFFNIELMANKEWGVNGITGKSVEFDITPTIAAAWGLPVYGPVAFEGFANVNLPKGNDGFGNATVTEVLVHPKLMVDVGTFFGSKGYQIGVGGQYWLNKFGNDHDKDASGGSYEKAIFGEIAIHL
jgi:hypothetical protein